MGNYDKSSVLSILNRSVKLHDKYLSDLGKNDKKEKILTTYEKELSTNRNKIEVIIDSAINQIKKARSENSIRKLNDAGYQIGLQNVITMIKSGVIHSVDDFKCIIEVYKKDHNAISLIATTISSSDISLERKMAFSSLLPKDNIERNIDLLTRVKNNILIYMNEFNKLGIESQIDTLSRLFNDDLTLSENS